MGTGGGPMGAGGVLKVKGRGGFLAHGRGSCVWGGGCIGLQRAGISTAELWGGALGVSDSPLPTPPPPQDRRCSGGEPGLGRGGVWGGHELLRADASRLLMAA